MPKSKAPKFYAVHQGRQPGVYETWKECEAQIKGVSALFKGFASRDEAEAYVKYGPSASAATSAIGSTSSSTTNHLPPPASSSASTLGKRKSPQTADHDVVYTDGACSHNGQAGARAGMGIWWGEGDDRNESFRCPGAQTNNRAELMAIVMVLIRVKMSSKPLIIRTDSSYSIKCMTEWLEGWRRRGWMNSKGESVKNRDIIEYLALLLDSRERWGQTVTFEHVKGHSGDVGNDGADRLAVQGAWKEEEPDWDFKKQMEEFKALFEKRLQEREAKRKSKKPRSHSSVTSTSQSSSTSSFSFQGPVTNSTIYTPPPEASVDYTHFTSEEDMQILLSCLIDHPEDDLSD